MAQFVEVTTDELKREVSERHRGRVSFPLLKMFMESNFFVARLDRTGIQSSMTSLYSSLGAYIRSHELPIHICSRKGEIYLTRTDINEKGEPVDPKEHLKPVQELTEALIEER